MKMIIIYFLCCVVTSLSCSNGNQDTPASSNPTDTSYKVYRIDSINNYYLIYVSKKGGNFKIVSAKESSEHCNRIKKDNYYDFELSSMLIGEIKTPGFANCLWVDSVTKICLEDSISDLESAKNISGLCFKGME